MKAQQSALDLPRRLVGCYSAEPGRVIRRGRIRADVNVLDRKLQSKGKTVSNKFVSKTRGLLIHQSTRTLANEVSQAVVGMKQRATGLQWIDNHVRES